MCYWSRSVGDGTSNRARFASILPFSKPSRLQAVDRRFMAVKAIHEHNHPTNCVRQTNPRRGRACRDLTIHVPPQKNRRRSQ
jgi:hypothetical protein